MNFQKWIVAPKLLNKRRMQWMPNNQFGRRFFFGMTYNIVQWHVTMMRSAGIAIFVRREIRPKVENNNRDRKIPNKLLLHQKIIFAVTKIVSNYCGTEKNLQLKDLVKNSPLLTCVDHKWKRNFWMCTNLPKISGEAKQSNERGPNKRRWHVNFFVVSDIRFFVVCLLKKCVWLTKILRFICN